MLTPGVAGALTMMITNTLAVNFDAPRAWTGLGLSFVFGLLVLISNKSLLLKLVFYILNSLVIFCVAMGTNSLGQSNNSRSASLVGPAFAQGTDIQSLLAQQSSPEYCENLLSIVATAQEHNASPEQILELIRPCQGAKNEDNAAGSISSEPPKFFSPWEF